MTEEGRRREKPNTPSTAATTSHPQEQYKPPAGEGQLLSFPPPRLPLKRRADGGADTLTLCGETAAAPCTLSFSTWTVPEQQHSCLHESVEHPCSQAGQMQPPGTLQLHPSGPSPAPGLQSIAGGFQKLGEKQLFEKFWKGTFKAVATPRPGSVIVASITARRRTAE